MGATPTIPMFAPDGSTGDIPADRVNEALQAGGRLALNFTAPDGSTGLIPHDQVPQALAAGGRPSGVGQPPKPPTDKQLSSDTPLWQKALGIAYHGGQYLKGKLDESNANTMNDLHTFLQTGTSPLGQKYVQAAEASIPGNTAEAIYRGLPTALAAGQKFEQAAQLANNVPINVADAGSVAMKIQDMASAGASMPKVVRNFLSRVTAPNAPPLTYEEARMFYQNATRLSANEYQRLTPVLQRQVGMFTQALGKAIGDAADTVGAGDAYRGAMSEYRGAAGIANLKNAIGEKVVQPAIKGAAAALGAGSVYGVYNALRR